MNDFQATRTGANTEFSEQCTHKGSQYAEGSNDAFVDYGEIEFQKLSVGTSEAVSKAVFSVKATMPVSDTLKSPVSTKTTMVFRCFHLGLNNNIVEMCGVEVKMLANYLPNNEGSRQLYVYVFIIF